ncbi:hypothetical protein WJX75_002649 [Coccomyxa subellipsoidea]|uniref:Uncharacterized protein n=2 Tax=Trebouxiophyceae TaxID=75966 RepID=A0ABR2Z361_9CHLO
MNPLWSGYATLNNQIPVPVAVNCRNPEPQDGVASKSASAKQYFDDVAYITGDSFHPVTARHPKGDYNESWSLGIQIGGGCLIGSDNKPSCDLNFNAITRASGTSQIRRVPKDGTVEFVSCSVTMDTTTESSSTCFEDDSTTVLKIKTGFPENSISSIKFLSTYKDTAPEGPPGLYTLVYWCQFSFNPTTQINSAIDPSRNEFGNDQRISSIVPRVENNFGPAGNGGNLGRRLFGRG